MIKHKADVTISDELTDRLNEAVSYPLLVRETSTYGSGSARPVSRTGATSSLSESAREAIRETLGWRFRTDDTQGFLTSLEQSFRLIEQDGHMSCEWQPHCGAVQLSLGEITGAQASLYARAQSGLANALKLLEGLKPLRSDPDQEAIQAMVAMIRLSLNSLVKELAAKTGPRIERVSGLFEMLIGEQPDVLEVLRDLASAGGYVGQLRDRLGLLQSRIATPDQEQNFTNFMMFAEYIYSLNVLWTAQVDYFRRRKPRAFLGTQLIVIAQALDVIVESVHQVYAAMDSVSFGSSERDVEPIGVDNALTIGELLRWIEEFAGVDALEMFKQAPRDAAAAFAEIATKLIALLGMALATQSVSCRALKTARVRRALKDLKNQIEKAKGLVAPIEQALQESNIGELGARVDDLRKRHYELGTQVQNWELMCKKCRDLYLPSLPRSGDAKK